MSEIMKKNGKKIMGKLVIVLARAYVNFFLQKKCHFATSPVFIGVQAVALWWH